MSNKETVEKLFKKGYSAYSISIKSGISIKECYHWVRQSEELKQRHQAILRAKEQL